MDRYRITASIVIMFIYLLVVYPWPTIYCSIILGVIYFIIIRYIGASESRSDTIAMKRRIVLNEAKIYLSPYTDIWRNLKLSNKYCSLRLGADGYSITARDSSAYSRSFKVVRSRVHSNSDLWDMLCLNFSYNTTFDSLIELCEKFNVDINISNDNSYNNKHPQNNNLYESELHNFQDVMISSMQEKPEKKELLDVNNASEVELTALPGVSIVMAKKLIKRREEIGGFKSVSDVCMFLKLKPHMQTQLEQLICVNKMKGSINIKRYSERNVDI